MDILVNVANQKLKIATNLKSLVAGTQEFVRFVFNLTCDWDNLMTFAQFCQNGVAYNQYLDENNSVYLPSEIDDGICTLTLCGNNGDVKAVTDYVALKVKKNILVNDASSTEITPSLYDQLTEMVQNINTSKADLPSDSDGNGNLIALVPYDFSEPSGLSLGKNTRDSGINPETLSTHLGGIINGQNGYHGIRYYNGNLQVKVNNAWQTVNTGGESGGQDGITPHIGQNGHWYLGNTDTGVSAVGENGVDGEDGEAATVTIGTVTTLDAGHNATVTNSGTSTHAVLNFGIPRGADGVGSGSGGADGEDGKGIASTEIQYKASSSGTVAPSGTWTTTIPSVSSGQYLWTRIRINYTDGDTDTAYSVSRNGTNGINGTNGTNGADGDDGITPTIGQNGHWYIGNEDTGVQAQGSTPVRGTDYWTNADKQEIVFAVLGLLDASEEVGY